jgi:hypothetical protein
MRYEWKISVTQWAGLFAEDIKRGKHDRDIFREASEGPQSPN